MSKNINYNLKKETSTYDKKLIKEIIADGYNRLDIISLETDISMEELLSMKEEVELEKKQKLSTYVIDYNLLQKMKQLRHNYELLYYSGANGEYANLQGNSENKVITEAIQRIEELIDNKSIGVRAIVLGIKDEIENLKQEEFSVDQAYKLVSLIYNKEKMTELLEERNKTINYVDDKNKISAVKKLVEAIEEQCKKANNVEQLKFLKSRLPYCIDSHKPVLVAALRMKLDSKISKLKSSESLYNMENNISKDMFELAESLTSIDPDINKIEEIIDREIEKRLESSPKTIYALNGEQHKTQIYYQLGKIFELHGKEYDIQNPEKMIDTLQKLFGMGLDSNIRMVIHGYIEKKQYKKAKDLCDKYANLVGKNQSILKSVNRIRSRIQMAEIGNIILKGMMVEATPEEQAKFYSVIENYLKQSKSTMSVIPLGRSQDGRREITLANIWYDTRNYPEYGE